MMRWIWPLVVLLLVAEAPAAAPTDAALERMKTISGRLYMNDRDLASLYQDMRGYAQFSMNGPERQLDYIQKLSLVIDRAKTQGYFLWRMLSVFDYLAEARQSDFLTLYEAELQNARDDCRMSIRLIDLYAAFIEREEIRKTLQDVVGVIEANVYMYEELVELIEPSMNRAPYPRRIQ